MNCYCGKEMTPYEEQTIPRLLAVLDERQKANIKETLGLDPIPTVACSMDFFVLVKVANTGLAATNPVQPS